MDYNLLISLIATIVFALGNFIVATIQNARLKKQVITLEEFLQDDKTDYYVICPQCENEIHLNKVKIYAKNIVKE